VAGGGELEKLAAQGRPRRLRAEPQHELVSLLLESAHGIGAEDVAGGDAERVVVRGDRRRELNGGVRGLAGAPDDPVKARVREVQADVAPSLPVTYESVARSAADLDALTSQILADAPGWAKNGIELSTWGPDAATNTVLVTLKDYDPESAALIADRYGSDVSVSTASVTAAGSSRDSDSAPWYGGSKITNGGYCTSWFAATRNSDSKTVMLTAGHCGSGAWKQGGATFGTTSKISFGGRTDEQVLPVTSNAARIFSDPTSTSRRVSSVATSDPIGTLLCTDGYTDREVCNVKVMAIGQVVTYNGATVTGLVQAKQTQGKKAFSPGDSGGRDDRGLCGLHVLARMVYAGSVHPAGHGRQGQDRLG
jgi:hypothetical protein